MGSSHVTVTLAALLITAFAVGLSGCAGSTHDGSRTARRAAPTPAVAEVDPSVLRARALEEFEAAQAACAPARANPQDSTKRLLATKTLEAFYDKYRTQPELLGDLVVEAAHDDATIRKSARDPVFGYWYRQTVEAFGRYRAATRRADGSYPTDGTRIADLGAEAAYALADARIVSEWDRRGRLTYDGDSDEAFKVLDRDVETRERLFGELESIRFHFRSHRLLPLLLAREATLYDTHRDAFLAANVVVIPADKAKRLARLEAEIRRIIADPNSSDRAIKGGQLALVKLQEVRLQVGQRWSIARPGYLYDMELRLAQRYRAATLRAAALGVVDPLLALADRRLAQLTTALGNAQMQTYLAPSPSTPEAAEWARAFPPDRCE